MKLVIDSIKHLIILTMKIAHSFDDRIKRTAQFSVYKLILSLKLISFKSSFFLQYTSQVILLKSQISSSLMN